MAIDKTLALGLTLPNIIILIIAYWFFIHTDLGRTRSKR